MKRMIDYFNEEAEVHDDHFINQMGMAEFYDEIEKQLYKCTQKNNILILGCGTGLEIERIKFKTNVNAIDISPKMLDEVAKKRFFNGIHLETFCASILDYNFGEEKYDIVLTCYTLHHFNPAQKLDIFRRIQRCLNKSGIFINGDTSSKNIDEEAYRMNEAKRAYEAERLPFGSLHIDVPLTFVNEMVLLKEAGFKNISLEREWDKTKLYRCVK